MAFYLLILYFFMDFVRNASMVEKIPRQAYNRIRPQRFILDHQTAAFHPLESLRDHGRELRPKHLRHIRNRCPLSVA